VKRLIHAILGLLLLAASAVVQAQSGSGDGFNYTINASNANTITITGQAGLSGVVIIPTNINNLLVTVIGNGANPVFDGPELTSITIPGSVTSIGQYAFYNCSGLTNLTITRQRNQYCAASVPSLHQS